MLKLDQQTVILDIDPAVYACAFAAQKKRYIYADEEGSILIDYHVEKRASRGWCAVTQTKHQELQQDGSWKEKVQETVHATGFSRALLQENMDAKMAPYEREEYLHVEPLENALTIARTMIDSMIKEAKCPQFIGALTTGQNFRNAVATIKEYKGNRKSTEKPVYYAEVREYFMERYNCVMNEGYEADDFLATMVYANPEYAVCASIDKDLDTVAGDHYKHNKDKDTGERWYHLTQYQAMYNFYHQMLTGDATDNIPGLPGVGPKRADTALEHCTNISELHEAVCQAYIKKFGDEHEYEHWKLGRINALLEEAGVTEWEDYMDDATEGLPVELDQELTELVMEREGHPTGFMMCRTWKEMMTEMGQLLWMVRDPEEPLWSVDYMETTIIPEYEGK